MRVAEKIKEWLRNEDGAVAVEYTLIAGAMGLALVPALSSLTDGVGALYMQISDLFHHPSVTF